MQAQAEGSSEMRPHYGFSRIASREVIPTLLELLTRQDEDASDEDYNISRAAYQCLQLFSQAVGSDIVDPVLKFIEVNLKSSDWHKREAAVSAIGAIMDGPEEKTLDPIVRQGLPVLLEKMRDPAVQVQDAAAHAIGRICENIPESIEPQTQLPSLIEGLFGGLSSNPKMAASCCFALMCLADRFAGEPGCQENALSPHFQGSVTALLAVTGRLVFHFCPRESVY